MGEDVGPAFSCIPGQANWCSDLESNIGISSVILKDTYPGTSKSTPSHLFYRDVGSSTPQCTYEDASPAVAFVGDKTQPNIHQRANNEATKIKYSPAT